MSCCSGPRFRQQSFDENEKPSREEYAVAKHLRFNLPTRQGKLVGITVQYFTATKAVDMLLESKWGVGKAKDKALFSTRAGCVDYMDGLLQKGMFHRAAKIVKKDKDREREGTKKKKVKETEDTKDEDKKTKKDKKNKNKDDKEDVTEKEKDEEKDTDKHKDKDTPKAKRKDKDKNKDEKGKESEEEKKDEEKKKKKKVRLEMHNLQVFKDGSEVYVWIYDPVPIKTFIIGLLLVLGAIAVCLFPLWPPEVRLGVYYLSLCAAGFVGVMLALCVIRLIVFCCVWTLTFGKHYFWMLPNLTEDVGFFDSFRPLYTHSTWAEDNAEKDKDDDKEDDKVDEEVTQPLVGEKEEEEEPKKDSDAKEESGSENDNFEIVEKNELENLDEEGHESADIAQDENEPDAESQSEEEEEEEEELEEEELEDESTECKKDK